MSKLLWVSDTDVLKHNDKVINAWSINYIESRDRMITVHLITQNWSSVDWNQPHMLCPKQSVV